MKEHKKEAKSKALERKKLEKSTDNECEKCGGKHITKQHGTEKEGREEKKEEE